MLLEDEIRQSSITTCAPCRPPLSSTVSTLKLEISRASQSLMTLEKVSGGKANDSSDNSLTRWRRYPASIADGLLSSCRSHLKEHGILQAPHLGRMHLRKPITISGSSIVIISAVVTGLSRSRFRTALSIVMEWSQGRPRGRCCDR